MARKYHPDRVETQDKPVANDKFHIIYQAYTILTNEEKKKLYDSGDSDVIFSKKMKSASWERHMKVIPDDVFEQAAKEYKNSIKEQEDIIREFTIAKGSMTHLLNHIPFMRVEDQPRIIEIIKQLMNANKISNYWQIKIIF